MIRIERAWDVREGEIEPKSHAGRRTVPIGAVLRDHLVEHKQRGSGDGLVFGRPDGKAFDGPTIDARAKAAWRAAEVEPITLHEARHTFASLMIAAGVNAKAKAAALLDAYLARADTQARLAQLER